MHIGKLCFGADDFQYGVELCLHKAGYTAIKADRYNAKSFDVLLVTMFWFRDIYFFERFRREAGLIENREKGPVVVIGGVQATVTPELCAEVADYVFIGDGDDHLKGILDEIAAGEKPTCEYLYWKGKDKIPEPAECEPSAFAMQKGNLGNTTRIEVARGCKFKCKFCVLSGLKSYREVPAADIIALLEDLAAKKRKIFSLFAPERHFHSGFKEINDAVYRLKLTDVGADTRLENLNKVVTHKRKRNATFGLEGISFKLRKSIGKSFTNDYILEQMGEFTMNSDTVVSMTAYFIADLPGECDEDWLELTDLFERIEAADWSRHINLSPVLNPLSPKPFTPLEHAEVHPFRDYPTKWLNFCRKNNKRWGFRILEAPVWHPWIRVLDALIHRGGPQAYEVIKRMPSKLLSKYPKKVDSVYMAKKFLIEVNKYGITDEMLFAGKPETVKKPERKAKT